MSGQDSNLKVEVGDVVTDQFGEWVIISIHEGRISRVRRNSLAHKIHAQSSSIIAKSLIVEE